MSLFSRLFIIIVTAFSVVFLGSCVVRKNSSANIKSRTVQHAPFHILEVEDKVQVEYSEGLARPAVIEADEETLDRVCIEVKEGQLSISIKDDNIIYLGEAHPVKVTLSSPHLDQIILASGSIHVSSALHADSLELVIAGSGKADMDSVICKGRFSSTISGSGHFKANNIQAVMTEHAIAGSGLVEVAEKGVQSSEFSITGSGVVKASLDSCGKVSAGIVGSGQMFFSGQADCLEQEIAGSGVINTTKLTVTSSRP